MAKIDPVWIDPFFTKPENEKRKNENEKMKIKMKIKMKKMKKMKAKKMDTKKMKKNGVVHTITPNVMHAAEQELLENGAVHIHVDSTHHDIQ